MKPHNLFTVWSPESVAECLEGVSPELYRRLWQLAEELPADTSEVPDNFEVRCLAKVWDKLTPEEQSKLNELAKKNYGNTHRFD